MKPNLIIIASLDAVDCGPPDPPANGSLIRNDSTLEGTRIYYECNDGLLPNGHAIAVCNSKEMWTPPLTCREPGADYYELLV